MKAHLAYFERMSGPWVMVFEFRITDWAGFLGSRTSWIDRLRLMALLVSQMLFGSHRVDTRVSPGSGPMLVRHDTLIRRFGLTVFRSEKVFRLDENGTDLRLTGANFYWPFLRRACLFPELQGKVLDCATRAEYQMPFAGVVAKCVSVMEEPLATLTLETPWLKGTFSFTPESMRILGKRIPLEVTQDR